MLPLRYIPWLAACSIVVGIGLAVLSRGLCARSKFGSKRVDSVVRLWWECSNELSSFLSVDISFFSGIRPASDVLGEVVEWSPSEGDAVPMTAGPYGAVLHVSPNITSGIGPGWIVEELEFEWRDGSGSSSTTSSLSDSHESLGERASWLLFIFGGHGTIKFKVILSAPTSGRFTNYYCFAAGICSAAVLTMFSIVLRVLPWFRAGQRGAPLVLLALALVATAGMIGTGLFPIYVQPQHAICAVFVGFPFLALTQLAHTVCTVGEASAAPRRRAELEGTIRALWACNAGLAAGFLLWVLTQVSAFEWLGILFTLFYMVAMGWTMEGQSEARDASVGDVELQATGSSVASGKSADLTLRRPS